jgi:hypothetical protein
MAARRALPAHGTKGEGETLPAVLSAVSPSPLDPRSGGKMRNLSVKDATPAELAAIAAVLEELTYYPHLLRRHFRRRLLKVAREVKAESLHRLPPDIVIPRSPSALPELIAG